MPSSPKESISPRVDTDRGHPFSTKWASLAPFRAKGTLLLSGDFKF